MPWDISCKCIYGRLEQRFKLALSGNIGHRFCNTSFKTLKSKVKRNFISTILAIFIFLVINISNGKQMAAFIKDFIIIELFYYSEAADSPMQAATDGRKRPCRRVGLCGPRDRLENVCVDE